MILLLLALFLPILSFSIFYLRTRNCLPLTILPAFYTLTIIYTFIGLRVFEFGTKTPFNFYQLVRAPIITEAMMAYLHASVAFCLGCILAISIHPRNNYSFGPTFDLTKKIRSQSSLRIFSLAILSGVIYILSYGLSDLLYRTIYISEDRFLEGITLSRLILPASLIACAFIRGRTLRYSAFLINYLPVFSASSRAMLLVIFFYALGVIIRDKKITASRILFTIAITIFSSAVAFEFRNNTSLGLVPNLNTLITDGFPWDGVILSLNYLFSFSVSVTAYMLAYIPNNESLVWAQLNPLPSSISGYDESSAGIMINKFAPEAALGQLYLNGMIFFYSFYFILGLSMSLLYISSKHKIQKVLVLISLSLFALTSTQYPIRGSMRIIYYSVLFYFAIAYLFKLKIKHK